MDRQKRAIDAYKKNQESSQGDADVTTQPDDSTTAHRTERNPGQGGLESDATSDQRGSGSAATPHLADQRDDSESGFEKAFVPADSLVRQSDWAATLGDLSDEDGLQRAARLLIAMGSDHAAEVLSHLPQDLVERVTTAIIQIPRVHRGDLNRELESRPTRAPEGAKGGPEVARAMLIAALGEEAGERAFFRAVPNAPERHFAFLNDLEPRQLNALLNDESPGAIAIVLAHIERGKAAEAMSGLDQNTKADVARRIAVMGRLTHDVIVRIEEALREKVRRQGQQVTDSVDGPSSLVAILRHMNQGPGEDILHALEVVDDRLARTIREQILTIDIVFRMRDRDVSDLLREFDDHDLALFLRGKSQEIRRRILGALSERRAFSVSDEYAHMGAQPANDVQEITSAVLRRIRDLQEDGSILVPEEGERYI